MDRPLFAWAMLVLRLALVLLALGLLPALLVGTLWPDIDALIPALLLFSVAPLGAVALCVALILFLAARLRR
jgi:hypothetical protein